MSSWSLVIIESPFAGEVERNRKYLQRAIRDCIERKESPYASHQMLTDALNDLDADERKKGIEAGLAWNHFATKIVVYHDYGISPGMQKGIDYAKARNRLVEYRLIGFNEVEKTSFLNHRWKKA